jgi:hypothetical protein
LNLSANFTVKISLRLTKHHTMKALVGVDINHKIFSGLDGGECSASGTGPFPTDKGPPVLIDHLIIIFSGKRFFFFKIL